MVRVLFWFQVVVSTIWLSGVAMATDGDVDYSSPYITVDPETGQLVTKNPGPRLKTHTPDMSGMGQMQMEEMPVESSPVASQAATQSSADVPTNEGSQSGLLVIGAVAVLVFGTMAFRRFSRAGRQNLSDHD